MMGGFGQEQNADDSVKKIATEMKATTETKLNKKFSTFEAVSFKSQVVAGTNYAIKVKTDSEYVHIKVYQSLPHMGSTLELLEFVGGKGETDPITI